MKQRKDGRAEYLASAAALAVTAFLWFGNCGSKPPAPQPTPVLPSSTPVVTATPPIGPTQVPPRPTPPPQPPAAQTVAAPTPTALPKAGNGGLLP